MLYIIALSVRLSKQYIPSQQQHSHHSPLSPVVPACSHAPARLPHTVAPNGVSTGLDIGLSLVSLHFITLSFYTMCKATSPLFLLFFAILWGLERLNLSLVVIVGTITPGLALLVRSAEEGRRRGGGGRRSVREGAAGQQQ